MELLVSTLIIFIINMSSAGLEISSEILTSILYIYIHFNQLEKLEVEAARSAYLWLIWLTLVTGPYWQR